jgi:flagellar hook-length control protein FliK
LGLVSTDKPGDAKLSLTSKEQKETRPEDLVANPDGSVIALAMPALIAPDSVSPSLVASANVTPQLNPQNTSSLSEGDANSQMSLSSDGTAQKQQSLDAMLGNALLQAKNTTTAGKEAVDSAVGKVSDQASWVNNILENAPIKAVREDIVINRALLNAVNDVANREIAATTATTIQPQVAQVNNALAAQQPGSANTINAYPGKAGWDQAISQKVVWMVGAGEQTASLTLNPPDLGPLKVVIHVHNDQADTTFISDNDEVRQAVENGLSNLRDKMSESGIQLGQTNVSTSSQSQQSFQQATQNRSLGRTQGNAASPQVEAAANTRATVRVANGLVDTFA